MDRLLKLLRDNARNRTVSPPKAKAEESGESTLYLYDVIVSDDYWGGISAEKFVKELNALDAPTIHLRINSPGGEVFAARAIEAAIRNHPARIVAHVDLSLIHISGGLLPGLWTVGRGGRAAPQHRRHHEAHGNDLKRQYHPEPSGGYRQQVAGTDAQVFD